MKYTEFKHLLYSDLYRINGIISFNSLLSTFFRRGEFRYNFWMRLCSYTRSDKIMRYSLYFLARFILNHLQYKFGIRIQPTMVIGPGLFIGHFGGINVSVQSKIGKNLNISQQVTIGVSNRGGRKGVPTIGDNVYIGPGARIFGNIKIGNNVAVGANCVVTKDVPDNSVIVGIPGKVISKMGSKGYINNTDYDKNLKLKK